MSSAAWLALCCLLAAAAYLPALNNGFIADDYVILNRVEILKTQPLYLYSAPPETFRAVSYVIFAALKAVAGYQAWLFYAVNIALHAANILLLWQLVRIVIGHDGVARLAVLLFAVFQAPQEAVMWLAAMNETTQFFFVLLTLLAWWQERRALAAAAYFLALFSKESAIIVAVFVILLDYVKGRPQSLRKYSPLLIPTAAFGAVFVLTFTNNFMLTNRSYAFGAHALTVLAVTIHRLLWPWFYIAAAAAWAGTRRLPSLRTIALLLGMLTLTMMPYLFIAYQSSLPSRQLYMASAVLVTTVAVLLRPLGGSAPARVVVIAFVAYNIGYLWLRKDAQFEGRAAPTTELAKALEHYAPQKTIVRNFPYPQPDIAPSAAWAAPGWRPELVLREDDGSCVRCLRLEWIPEAAQYRASGGVHENH